jgi:CheY-like chemotaxis protein
MENRRKICYDLYSSVFDDNVRMVRMVMENAILVVEDDIFYGKLLVSILSYSTSYQIQLVQTGTQALNIAQEISPILLLLDYQLPDMTGIKLYDQFHKIAGQERVPAIMLSSELPNQELEEQLLAREMVGMNKIFRAEYLLEAIDKAVIRMNGML